MGTSGDGGKEPPRLRLTDGMRRLLDYRKFAGATRMLVLETEYFFDKSWLRAAQSLGWETATVRSAMTGGLTRDDIASLFTTLAEFRPDFILASNFAGMDVGGLFARFFEDAHIPYVSWFTDTPRMILFGREMFCSHYMVAATWERAYIPHFQKLGFEHVFFMPLATDPELFNAPPATEWERPLSFVGSSMVQQVNEAWEKFAQTPEIIAAILKAFEEGCVTRENFINGIDAVLPQEILQNRDASILRNIELCLIYEATRRQRAEMVLRLNPLDLEVRGDANWHSIASRVGGSVGYYDHLAPYYRSTAVNVNNTSLQMRFAVNQRVFDCPAAGGFLISDNQEDLTDFFDPEKEVVVYNSLEELEDKVQFYLAHPQERIELTTRARKRVLAHHTHAHRLSALETFLQERYT